MSESSLSMVAEIARRMKGEKVRLYGNDPDESESDLMSFVTCVRQGRQTFVAYVGPGPYAARQCAYYSALLTQCDEFFLVADARYRAFEPLEGWHEGMSNEEYEKLFYEQTGFYPGKMGEDWEAGNRQDIQECLAISRYALLGPPTIAHYNYTREGTKLTWTHVAQIPPDELSGAIDDYIREGIIKRKEIGAEIQHWMDENAASLDLTYEQAKYHGDRAMAKALSRQPGVFIVTYIGQPDRSYSFQNGEEFSPEYF